MGQGCTLGRTRGSCRSKRQHLLSPQAAWGETQDSKSVCPESIQPLCSLNAWPLFPVPCSSYVNPFPLHPSRLIILIFPLKQDCLGFLSLRQPAWFATRLPPHLRGTCHAATLPPCAPVLSSLPEASSPALLRRPLQGPALGTSWLYRIPARCLQVLLWVAAMRSLVQGLFGS